MCLSLCFKHSNYLSTLYLVSLCFMQKSANRSNMNDYAKFSLDNKDKHSEALLSCM